MTSRPHRLIKLWRKCPVKVAPFILPEDRDAIGIQALSEHHSFEDYVAGPSFGQSSDTSLHVGLLPIPYVGNLQKATVFVLMLNPGLSPGDYLAERKDARFRKALVNNLRQEQIGEEYPFFILNPVFAGHPGFTYWQKKFENIVQALMIKEKIPYTSALKRVAQTVACLELLPYHSRVFGAGALLSRLPSAKVMLEFVNDILLHKVRRNEVTIVVTRGARTWNLPKHNNIVTYEGGETRSAHLTLQSRGGHAIAQRLGF